MCRKIGELVMTVSFELTAAAVHSSRSRTLPLRVWLQSLLYSCCIMAESVEFEHFIGMNMVPSSTLFHPNGQKYIFSSGASLVIGDLIDQHSQQFLRRHDDSITCIALSASGRMLASGQRGENSNIYVWDFESQQLVYSFEEHDFAVQHIAFSEDEKLLASIGSDDDAKLIIWDLSNGCIVASAGRLALGTTCVCFAGFVKDIKRRNTSHYLVCSAGAEGIVLWDLDPFSGDFLPMKLTGEARATVSRHITAVSFSDDREFVYGATTSGDYIVGSVRVNKIVQVVQATKMQLNAILYHDTGVVIGCGDSTIKMYTHSGEYKGQLKLDGPVISISPSPDRLEVNIHSLHPCHQESCLSMR